MDLYRLVALLVIVRLTLGCNVNSPNILPSSVAFFMTQGSTLNFHWNIQNMSSDMKWEIEWNCCNPIALGDGNNQFTTQNKVDSFVLLNISEITLSTSCEVCIVQSGAAMFGIKVSFSLDNYCSNGLYNISPDSQVVIQCNNVPCFSCFLPGQNKIDIWQVDSTEIVLGIATVGSLIVTSPLELFGCSSMSFKLTCGNRASNVSTTVLIAYKGSCNETALSRSTVSPFQKGWTIQTSLSTSIVQETNYPILPGTTYTGNLAASLGASASFLVITTMGVLFPLLLFRAVIQKRSKNVRKQDISLLNMVLAKHAAVSKTLSNSSITTNLDKLEPFIRVDLNNNEETSSPQFVGNISGAANQKLETYTTLPITFEYIGITDDGKENHLNKDTAADSDCSTIQDTHLQSSEITMLHSSIIESHSELCTSLYKDKFGCCDSDQSAIQQHSQNCNIVDLSGEEFAPGTKDDIIMPACFDTDKELVFGYVHETTMLQSLHTSIVEIDELRTSLNNDNFGYCDSDQLTIPQHSQICNIVDLSGEELAPGTKDDINVRGCFDRGEECVFGSIDHSKLHCTDIEQKRSDHIDHSKLFTGYIDHSKMNFLSSAGNSEQHDNNALT